MIRNYFSIALRNIFRNKTISFINIFGLAISMSICLLLIIIVADQFSYDNFHSNKDRIYRVITERQNAEGNLWSTASTTFPLADVIKDNQQVEKITRFNTLLKGVVKWKSQEIPFEEGYFTDNNFLSVFDFPLEKGNPSNALALPNAIVLTKPLANKIFGATDPLNEVVTIEGKGEFVVTGVFAEMPGKTHLKFEALGSLNFLTSLANIDSTVYTGFDDWQNIYQNYIYFLAKEYADLGGINTLLNKAVETNYETEGEFSYNFKLQPLTGITPGPLLSNSTGFGLPDFMIYTLLGVALVVLSSTCFNYANLTTARAMNRAKEIGVRKVVGAGKHHIFAQFIVESVLIALIAFVFGDLLAQFILPRMNSFFSTTGAPVSFDETPHLYLWFIGFVLIAGLLAGLIPALFFSATNPLAALKKSVQLSKLSNRFGFSRFDVRKVLVVVQFAFSIFFVITMITIYQQSRFVLTTDHGFRTDGVVNVKLQGINYDKVVTSFDSIAGVQLVAASTYMPALGTNNTTDVYTESREEPIVTSYLLVDKNYIEAMDLDLVFGNNFPEIMPGEERYILINEQAVYDFGWDSPSDALGKTVDISDHGEVEIIGVLKNFHYERMDEEIGPMMLRYGPQSAVNAIVIIDQQNARQVLGQLASAWSKITNRPFDYSFYEDDLYQSYGYYDALVMALGYVTLIIVSLACLGLLGMVIYHIQNRTKEIGIRKTMGAGAYNILFTVGKGFLILILTAYIIGGPAAYFVNNMWLQANAYRIDFGLSTILSGLVVVLVIVVLTVGAQLYKAIRIDPVESLKSE